MCVCIWGARQGRGVEGLSKKERERKKKRTTGWIWGITEGGDGRGHKEDKWRWKINK